MVRRVRHHVVRISVRIAIVGEGLVLRRDNELVDNVEAVYPKCVVLFGDSVVARGAGHKLEIDGRVDCLARVLDGTARRCVDGVVAHQTRNRAVRVGVHVAVESECLACAGDGHRLRRDVQQAVHALNLVGSRHIRAVVRHRGGSNFVDHTAFHEARDARSRGECHVQDCTCAQRVGTVGTLRNFRV